MASARQSKAIHEIPRQGSAQSQGARPRTATDSRRQQNRTASKVYRELSNETKPLFTQEHKLTQLSTGEKRKQKLEFLEKLASSQQQVSIPEIVPSVLRTSTGVGPSFAAQADVTCSKGFPPIPQRFSPVDWNCYLNTTLLSNNLTRNDAWNWQYETQLHSTSAMGSSVENPHVGMIFDNDSIVSNQRNLGTYEIPLQGDGIDGLSYASELSLPISPLGVIDTVDNFAKRMTPSVRNSQYPMPSIDGYRQTFSSSLPSIRNSPVSFAHKLVSFFYELGVDQRRYLFTKIHQNSLKFVDVLSFLANSAENLPEKELVNYKHFLNCTISTLPSLQLNNIHIMQASFWAAILANARILGFELEDYLNEESISPISILSTSIIDEKEVEKAIEHFSTAPRDLRPSRVQFEKEHHAYLDVLPFPKFRAQTLAAVSSEPPLIDEEELCMDLMNDGLVCWGSQGTNNSINAGMPWDSRSWEPQLWFLKKYWFLVGSQDDEMWSCTEWWHRMRGEEIF
jgi:hypothetical protein